MRNVYFVAPILCTFLSVGTASASFHLMQIEQVIGGVNGDTSAQAIQLRMRAAGQNQVSQARLVVRDATGRNPVTIVNMTSDVTNSSAGARILICSANFPSYTSPLAVPDFTMTNLIPASYLAAGSLTFESDLGTTYWRLSWGGVSYTGSSTGDITNDSDGVFNPPFASALPSTTRQALQFAGTANALSTNNAAQYALTSGAAVFVRNAGTTYTVVECTVAAQCNDGLYCNGTESCTLNTCAVGSDPCPGFTCDEVNNVCGTCLTEDDQNSNFGLGPDEGVVGSLLIFPKVELRWDLAGTLLQDTFIRISNTSQAGSVWVKMFFVNGDPPLASAPPERAHPGWNVVDNTIVLTQSEPAYWSANTGMPKGVSPFGVLDPGTPRGRPDPEGNPNVRVLRGFIYAWAVAVNSPHAEISWNFLKGEATVVNYQEGSAWEYGAIAFQAVNAATGTEPDGVRGQLLLNGIEYDSPFDTLFMDFISTGSTSMSSPTRTVTADGELVLLPAGGDFRQDGNGPTTTQATFATFNANEVLLSGTKRCLTCWDQRTLSLFSSPNNFQRTVLGTDAGRARIEAVADATCSDPIGGASEAAPLIGVHAHRLSFSAPGARVDRAGGLLPGQGSQSASILFDVIDDPRLFAEPSSQVIPAAEDRSRLNRKGSLLVFPKIELKWDSSGNLTQDTIIQLSNNDRCDPVRVRLALVQGDPPLAPFPFPFERAHTGWNHLFDDVVLTANQPAYWSAATGAPMSVTVFTALDPGNPPGRPDPEGGSTRALRGYMLAWAVDDDLEEVRWNHLTGRATIVNYAGGSAWDYNPRAFRARGGFQGLPPDGVSGQLLLNGTEYDLPHDQLEFDFQASGSTALSGGGVTVNSNSELVMMPANVFLPSSGTLPTRTNAQFTIYNANEVQFTGVQKCITAWDQSLTSSFPLPTNAFLRTTLQTDGGRARFDGQTSASCSGGISTSLVGVVANRLTFTGGPGGSTAAGVSMAGVGEQSGAIVLDAVACSAQANCNDFESCTCDSCVNGACNHSAVAFGNVNCSAGQATDLDDILCVLAGFSSFASCPNGDIAPTTGAFACEGNNAIDLDDILSVLAAFGGADPCGC